MNERFTVFVGGGEVNNFLLPKDKALEIADSWIEDGYDDVVVCELVDGEFIPIEL